MKSSAFFLFASLLLCTACQEDEVFVAEEPPTTPSAAYPNVPTGLWDYFDRFEAAAQNQGRSIDLRTAQITAEFADIDGEGVAGTCTYGSHLPGHVVIDEQFWSRASDLLKEMIVFHELGHCVLMRDHWEGVQADVS